MVCAKWLKRSGQDEEAVMSITEQVHTDSADVEKQFVSFLIQEECFAFQMLSVGEIIRVPVLVSVPLGPPQMQGLANLRGNVLPVYDLSMILLGKPSVVSDVNRVIVVDTELGSIGFLVDRVLKVYSVPSNCVVDSDSKAVAVAYDYLDGIIKQADMPVEQILNVSSLAKAQSIAKLESKNTTLSHFASADSKTNIGQEADDLQQLVCFSLEAQDFALHLQDVQEIVRVPDAMSQLPDSLPCVLGLVNLRGRIIPIIDLASTIHMKSSQINDASRIVIIHSAHYGSIGFVVAKVSNVMSICSNEMEPVPSVCNDGAESGFLEAVYRRDGGKSLVSIISLENIFMRSLSHTLSTMETNLIGEENVTEVKQDSVGEDDYEQYVIFWIEGQEYGVSIEDTQEITRVPEKLESVPGTPHYLKGIVNLRGTVLPVIDLRSRLNLPSSQSCERQRIVVLTKNKLRTGFIVDSVVEVKTVVRNAIEKAPSLSDSQSEFLNRLIKLSDEKRIIQLIEPSVLLHDSAVGTARG